MTDILVGFLLAINGFCLIFMDVCRRANSRLLQHNTDLLKMNEELVDTLYGEITEIKTLINIE